MVTQEQAPGQVDTSLKETVASLWVFIVALPSYRQSGLPILVVAENLRNLSIQKKNSCLSWWMVCLLCFAAPTPGAGWYGAGWYNYFLATGQVDTTIFILLDSSLYWWFSPYNFSWEWWWSLDKTCIGRETVRLSKTISILWWCINLPRFVSTCPGKFSILKTVRCQIPKKILMFLDFIWSKTVKIVF